MSKMGTVKVEDESGGGEKPCGDSTRKTKSTKLGETTENKNGRRKDADKYQCLNTYSVT